VQRTFLLFRCEKSRAGSKLYQGTEGNEHAGGEIKLGKMQVRLEKNQVTGAKRKKRRAEGHAGGGRCLTRIATLITWFSWKEIAHDFGLLSPLFGWEW